MRRRITILLVSVLLGAIVNVAVAWELSLLGLAPMIEESERSIDLDTFSDATVDYTATARIGWPAHSLCRVFRAIYDPLTTQNAYNERWTKSLQTPDGLDWLGIPAGHEFPLQPIWPGFAINTVFYAFILWLLFAAPFALRRRSLKSMARTFGSRKRPPSFGRC